MLSCLRISMGAAATLALIAANTQAADRTTTESRAEPKSTTSRPGAVTGAGQPQGTVAQPDTGAPGGLEPRARAADRATTTEAERRAPAGGSRTEPSQPQSSKSTSNSK